MLFNCRSTIVDKKKKEEKHWSRRTHKSFVVHASFYICAISIFRFFGGREYIYVVCSARANTCTGTHIHTTYHFSNARNTLCVPYYRFIHEIKIQKKKQVMLANTPRDTPHRHTRNVEESLTLVTEEADSRIHMHVYRTYNMYVCGGV